MNGCCSLTTKYPFIKHIAIALAINLAFTCFLRMGKMLGLAWDCVLIFEKTIVGQSIEHPVSAKESNSEKLLRILEESPELADQILQKLGTTAL